MSEQQFGNEAGTETRGVLYKAVSLNLHSTPEIKSISIPISRQRNWFREVKAPARAPE